MVKYDEIYDDVKKMLSEKRFMHSQRVVKRAIEYAEIYNVDIETVKIVAIYHDIAKNLNDEENKKYIKEYNIKLDEIEKINNSLLHAKIGTKKNKNRYIFTEDMVNSIKYHTTGRENMSILEKITYLADATEEGREYCSANYADIIKNDIDKGMFEISKWSLTYLLNNNAIIHPDTVKCYNFYNKF